MEGGLDDGGLDDGGLDGEMKDEGKRVVVLTCCANLLCVPVVVFFFFCLSILFVCQSCLFINLTLFSIVSRSHLFLTPLHC